MSRLRSAASFLPYLLPVGVVLALAATANPFPYFKDTAELSASAAGAGIAHPTGFSALHAAVAPVLGVPVGPLSLRLSLFVVLSAAVAAGAVVLLVRKATGGSSVGVWLASAAAAGLLLCDVVDLHARNFEVYMPALALSAFLAVAGVNAVESRSWERLLALGGGLSVGMHVVCPAAFAWCFATALLFRYLASRSVPAAKDLLVDLVLFGLGALCLLYLPVRAATMPARNWGDPSTLSSFWAHVSGRSIQDAFESEMLRLDLFHLGYYGKLYVGQLWGQTGPALLLAPAAPLLLRGRAGVRVAALLAGLWLADALFSVFLNPMAQLEKQTGTLSLFSVLALAAIACSDLCRRAAVRRRGLEGAVAAVASAALVAVPVLSLSAGGRLTRQGPSAYAMSVAALGAGAPEGVVASTTDDMSAGFAWISEIERRRPDVLPVVKQALCDPSFMEPLLSRFPAHRASGDVADVCRTHCSGPRREATLEAWKALLARLEASRMPLGWELGEERFDTLAAPRLLPSYPAGSVVSAADARTAGLQGVLAAAMQGRDLLVQSTEDVGPDAIADVVFSAAARMLGTHLVRLSRAAGDAADVQPLWSLGRDLLVMALDLNPANCGAGNNLAVMLAQEGDLERASAVGERVYALCPLHAGSRVNQVRYLLLAGRAGDARVLLESLCADFRYQDVAEGLERLARQLESLGLVFEAELVRATCR